MHTPPRPTDLPPYRREAPARVVEAELRQPARWISFCCNYRWFRRLLGGRWELRFIGGGVSNYEFVVEWLSKLGRDRQVGQLTLYRPSGRMDLGATIWTRVAELRPLGRSVPLDDSILTETALAHEEW